MLDIDPDICNARNKARPDRAFGSHVARNHSQELRRGLRGLAREGFRQVHVLRTPAEVEALEIRHEPLWTDRRGATGPFDIIGDIHGCYEELTQLLDRLGYERDPYAPGETLLSARYPEGRRVAFLGDITDRGPRNLDALRLVMGMGREGSAFCVMGNQDHKLGRWLAGKDVKLAHGLQLTVDEISAASEGFRRDAREFINGLRSHAWLAGGRLVVAHAGLKEKMHGRGSAEVRSFTMYGDTTGEVDEFGLPVRLDWARHYRGEAEVIYGHTPTPVAEWLNNTLCIDTGCVFGGKLTALRWPEHEIVDVPALRVWCKPVRPLAAPALAGAQTEHDRLLHFDDFGRKLRIETRLGGAVLGPEENALAVMSRFAVDPRWLIYLPPTMAAPPRCPRGRSSNAPSPRSASSPRAAPPTSWPRKSTWARAPSSSSRDAEAAARHFGTEDGKAGVVVTRTGRPFFRDDGLEAEVVSRLAAAARAGLWEELAADWLLLDAEIMPWSAKAQELLRQQYLPPSPPGPPRRPSSLPWARRPWRNWPRCASAPRLAARTPAPWRGPSAVSTRLDKRRGLCHPT